MPSTVEKLSPTRAKLVIDVPFEELQPAIDAAYQQIAQQVSVPGFRRGHVPSRLIDQRYGRGVVLQEAINAQVPQIVAGAITEHGLKLLGRPEVDLTRLEDGEAVEVTVVADVQPDIELPDLRAIAVTVDPVHVGTDELDERVDLLRRRFATYTDLDRPAQEGDVVVIDLRASHDGEPIEDATAEGMVYRVGQGGLVDGLDEAVTGLGAGGTATFVSTLVGGSHRGEPAEVTVTVNQVQAEELPAVDDEFAQMVSEYDTAAEMHAGLRDSLTRLGRLNQAGQARDKVLDAVIDATPFDLPEQVLADEIDARRQQITDQLAQAGLTVEDYLAANEEEGTTDPEVFFARIADQSSRALRAQIILDTLAEQTQVDVSQEDLSALLMQKAQSNGTTPEQEAQHMVEHDHMTEWLGEIRRSKALGAMVAQARVTDTTGAVVDLTHLRGDGTLAAPEPAAGDAPSITITSKKGVAKPKKKAADAGE